jgi:hypothetical protein
MGFITQEDERTNFLMKKYFRANSTKTTQPSNKLESIQTNSSLIVFNEEIYSTTIPSVLPTFDKNYKFIDVNSVNYNNGTRTITISGTASSLYASEGLTTEIWQAFKDQKLYQVDASSTTTHIVKISKLNLSYISDTASISESPSYYHTVLKDCIPSTAYGQIYPITVEGNSSAAPTPTSTGYSHPLPNDVTGNWYVQSDAGILQFFDENAILPSTSINLFNTGLDPNGVELFNTAKGPGITFYKYIGTKGITSSSGSGTGQYTNFSNSNIEAFEFPPSAMTSDTTVLSDGTYISSCSPNNATVPYKAFNKVTCINSATDDCWHGAVSGLYNSGGTYTGTVTTSNIDGSETYSGEWLQLQLPTSIILSKYKLYNRLNYASYTPYTYKLLGSSNNSTWTTIDYQENNCFSTNVAGTYTSINTSKSFYTKNNSTSYNYYRLISNKTNSSSYVAIGELVLYGQKYNDTTKNTIYLKNLNTNDINVGIGTNNPLGRLHIYNPNPNEDNLILTNGNGYNEFYKPQIKFGFGGTTDYSHFIGSRHNNGSATYNCIDFFCNTGNYKNNSINGNTKLVMTLEGTGNVGIGTSSPSSTLHVIGSEILTGSITIGNNGLGLNSTGERLILYNVGTQATNLSIGVQSGSMWYNVGASDSHIFYTNNTTRVYINSNGLFAGPITVPQNQVLNFSTNSLGTTYNTSSYLRIFKFQDNNNYIDYTHNLYFRISGGTPALTLDTAGNCGINGSITPSSLKIGTATITHYDSPSRGGISITDTYTGNGGWTGVRLTGGTANSKNFGIFSQGNQIGIYDETTPSWVWTYDSSTATTTYANHIAMTNTNITSVGTLSTINATVSGVLNPGSIASSAVNFEISCNGGTIHSNSIYNSVTSTGASVSITGTNGYLQRSSSSMKYKLNIEDLDDNISSKIYDFRAVWYRSDTTKCTMDNPLWSFIGFIAEEIALIEPRLASYEKLEDGTYEPEGVQYDRIVPLIVKELKKLRDNTSTQIQELSEKNIELETSYSNLQTINNNLQSQINSMQSQINTILTTLSL